MADKPSVKEYYEPAPETDFAAFKTIAESRRSVRRFADEPIPDDVVHDCLDLALLAPTSSNLQSWEFYRIVDPAKKAAVVEACLSQPAAATAPELIVAVARIDTWRDHADAILRYFEDSPYRWPETMKKYYRYVTRIAYSEGPLGLAHAARRALMAGVGLVRPIPRSPVNHGELVDWAVKTTALACENLMLAFRAAGYDTCPMEGFDEARVKKLLKLPDSARIPMVISAGRRRPGGIYGPRIRLARERFIHEV